MDSETVINRYLAAQRKARTTRTSKPRPARPFLTLSREAGAGGTTVGQRVADILNERSPDVPWTLLGQELVNVVLDEHNLPQEMSKYMAEGAVNNVKSFIDDMIGDRPPSHSLVRKTNTTVFALAQMGHTILVGRGANFLTRKLAGGFHVRLVASADKRTRHFQENFGLSEKDAAARMKKTDESRSHYVRDVFGQDVSDILAYDCVFNTTRLSFEAVARMIAVHLRD